MYMREMGTVELTREGEIVIAKRIEEGIRELMAALAFYPALLANCAMNMTWLRRKSGSSPTFWWDIWTRLITPSAQEIAEQNANNNSDDLRKQPTQVLILLKRKSATALKRQCTKTEKALQEKGYDSKEAQKEMAKLGELFKFFKLTPRVFDPLVETPRQYWLSLESQSENSCVLWCASAAWIEKISSRASGVGKQPRVDRRCDKKGRRCRALSKLSRRYCPTAETHCHH